MPIPLKSYYLLKEGDIVVAYGKKRTVISAPKNGTVTVGKTNPKNYYPSEIEKKVS